MPKSVQANITLNMRELNAAVMSYTCSKRYVGKLFPIVIINIMHNRLDIPDGEFEEEHIKDISIVVSKKSSKHKLIHYFYQWIKGAKAAFERDYLKDFYLLIKDKEGELKEWYQFNFRYSSTVLQENKVSRNALYDQTKRLFDDIKNLSFYPKWDNNDVNIRAEIVYNNNAPPLYEAPNYEPVNGNELRKVIKRFTEEQDKPFTLGELGTGYHTVNFRFGSKKITNDVSKTPSHTSVVDLVEEDAEVMYTAQEKPNAEAPAFGPKLLVDLRDSSDSESLPAEQKPEVPTLAEPAAETSFQKQDATVAEASPQVSTSFDVTRTSDDDVEFVDSNLEPFCVCNSSVTDEVLGIVTCSKCKNIYHCVCIGYLMGRAVPKKFCCPKCTKATKPSSPGTVSDDENNPFLNRLRLLLAYCYLTNEVPNKIMGGFPKSVQNVLWNNLEQLAIIIKKGDRYVVNQERLRTDPELREMFLDIPDSNEFSLKNQSPRKRIKLM